MEENENKKPEVNEPEAPEGAEEKPVENGSESPEKRGGKLDALKGKAKVLKDKAKDKAKVVKQKTGEFMGVKRNRIIVLACSGAAIIALVVGLSVGLTQCHGGNGGDTTSSSSSSGESKGGEGSGSSSSSSSSAHTHEYGTAWKSDATQHWHECSCGDKKDAANHTFGEERVVITPATESTPGKKAFECSVCKYTKDEVEYNPYISSEAAFVSALEFKGEKFTIHYVEDGDWSDVAKNGDILYNTSSFSEQNNRYYTKVTEGSDAKYYEYFQDKSGKWLKSEDPQETYDSYASFEVNAGIYDGMLTYAGLHFDASKGCYTASYTDSRSNSVSAELYFDNGRLIKAVSTSTTVTGKSSIATYTFSDSAVSLSLPAAEAHSHAFASDWCNDATSHWKECVCGEKDQVGNHRFGSEREVITPAESSSVDGTKAYKCSICGYAKDPIAYNPYVNNNNFDDAFVYDGDKFTATFQLPGSQKETMTKNGNVVHWKGEDGTEEYYTKVTEGSETKYYKYAKDSSGTWIKKETDDAYWDSYSSYKVNDEYFDDKLNYTDVTFNDAKGGYTMSYTVSSITVNAELYFDRGRLIKAIKSYGTSVETYTFSDEAEEITLPDAHMHVLPTSGKLDLNSAVPQLVATCLECDKEGERDFNSSTDTATSVLYGYYPQSHVSDGNTIASLDALTSADTATGWYKLGSDYYAKATSAAAVPSGLKFNDLTTIESGKAYWYKCDPIEWKVLTSSNGTYSLVSTLLLESHNFNSSSWTGTGTAGHYANNYEHSALRGWLTGEFFNKAFAKSPSPLSKIQEVTVDNSSSTFNYTGSNSNFACNDTTDWIYLLSQKECSAGTGSSLPVQEDRWCETSEYLRASGAGYVDANSNRATYWTRSPYAVGSTTPANQANVVTDNGGSSCLSVTDVNCVRPAITVKVS